MKRVLILGGTSDARALASSVSDLPNYEVIYSLAGKTRKPGLPACEVRTGGFGGAEGLAAYLAEASIDLVVDATHPFAQTMASHAADACLVANTARVKFCRPAWPSDELGWISVKTYQEAAAKLSALGDRVFLSIGTKDLDAFSALADKWFLIRAVEQPALPSPLINHALLLERGPFDAAHDRTIMVTYQIDVRVSKNSGGTPVGKIQAAHHLNIPIIMIEQPGMPAGDVVSSINDVVGWLEAHS
mgnify:CR=1 FL=1